jgi:hypothetical protein
MKTITLRVLDVAIDATTHLGRAYAQIHNQEIRSQMDDLTEQIQALRAQRSELKSQLIEL